MSHYSISLILLVFLAVPHMVSGDTNMSGAITQDTTLTFGGSPYIISGQLIVDAGIVLSIDPGVVLKFHQGAGMTINGELKSPGSFGGEVYFTSIRDDSLGGDSNLDGSATLPTMGDWEGIVFSPNSQGSFIFSQIKYSGKNLSPAIKNSGGLVSLSQSLISNFVLDGVLNVSGTTSLSQSTFKDGEIGFHSKGGVADIDSVIFQNIDNYGVLGENGESVVLKNSTFENLRVPATLDGNIRFIHSGNLATSSQLNGFEMIGSISTNQVWSGGDLPYIIYSFGVDTGGMLTIEPSAVVKLSAPGLFFVNGSLNINAPISQKVVLTSLKDDSFFGDTDRNGQTTTPSAGDWTGLYFQPGSYGSISGLTLLYGGQRGGGTRPINAGLYNEGGTVSVVNVDINKSLQDAIAQTSGTFSVSNSDLSLNEIGVDILGGSMVITGSSLENNLQYGVLNQTVNIVDARNNWWGDASGPFHPVSNPTGLGSKVFDFTDFTPWLGAKPGNSSCCSNVLFLPGFMASDLYEQGSLFENQLWPPTSLLKSDVDKLMLDSNGNPVTPGIYTKGIIEEAFGFNLYKSFVDHMKNLVQSGKIKEWLPFPYDWRKDFPEIVNNFTTIKNGSIFENKKLIDEAMSLAQRSPTGKIVVIGHSNGGLVGKYLIRELEKQGKESIIDQFVMVATPQTGTPKAISGLLHGDEQQILKGFLLDNLSARDLAFNLPGAYNLFPDYDYFQNNTGSILIFDDSIRDVFDYTLYGFPQSISHYSDLISFVSSSERGNSQSDPMDIPGTLRLGLLMSSNQTVAGLYSWNIPHSIAVSQIVGMGQQTTSGVQYQSRKEILCNTKNGLYICKPESFWDRRLLKTNQGDGTVVITSALNLNITSENYFFDINQANSNLLVNRKHSDLLEFKEIIQLLDLIIFQGKNFQLPLYTTKSNPTGNDSYQQISVHSPVSLSITDSIGRVVGKDIQQPSADFTFIREEIPNSSYFEINDQKYATIPLDAEYGLHLVGQGNGTFTLDIEQYQNGFSIKNQYIDIPVTPATNMDLVIDDKNAVGLLNVDINNDGQIDRVIAAQEKFDPVAYLEMIMSIIKNFDIKKSTEKKLIRSTDSIIESLKKIKTKQAIERTERFLKDLYQLLEHQEREGGFDKNEIQLLIQNLETFKFNLNTL